MKKYRILSAFLTLVMLLGSLVVSADAAWADKVNEQGDPIIDYLSKDYATSEDKLADMIASFMGVLELIKIRKILIEETEEAEADSIHGEGTRFFINPDVSDVEQINTEADFASLPQEQAQAAKSK